MAYDEATDFLRAREARNCLQVPNIDLFGEFGTTVTELETIASAICAVIRVRTHAGTYREFEEHLPVVFAEFVVAAGIHHYRKGNYWAWIHARIELPRQVYPTKWGELFERVVDTCQLESFAELESENATRFVSKFLAHGGIPTYSLNDYFEFLLAPAVRSGEYRELRPSELVRGWERRQSAILSVDKPVRRFLVYGGSVAHDFLGRSLEMAEYGLSGLPIPDAQDLGLPLRIVEAFQTWLQPKDQRPHFTKPSALARFTRPNLSYDPWAADALNLSMPLQPRQTGDYQTVWSIVAGSWSRRVDVTPDRQGDAATSAAELRLPAPFAMADVTLEINGERVRSWRFPGITNTRPVLVFDSSTGNFIDASDALEQDDYWLISPRSAVLLSDHQGQHNPVKVLEELPFLSGGWSQFKGLHVDLSQSHELLIRIDDQDAYLPIRSPAVGDHKPALIGGTRSQLPLAISDQLVFEGSPPVLTLPIPVRGETRLSASRWRVHVMSESDAFPDRDLWFEGDNPRLTNVSESAVNVGLESPELLGSRPIGNFRITARGPLGLDKSFQLLCIPQISVRGVEQLLIPENGVPPPANLTVTTSALVQTADSEVTVDQAASNYYRINVPGHLDQAVVNLLTAPSTEAEGHVRIALPLRRVRWAIAGMSAHVPNLESQVRLIARDELEHADAPTLIVDVPNADEFLLVSAAIENSGGQVLFPFPERPIVRSRRFSLHAAMDTIRAYNDSTLILTISVSTLHGAALPRRLVAAHLIRSLQISDLTVHNELIETKREVQVRWTETLPVTNRVIRFWPLWRLWAEQPFQCAVPDYARGEHTFTVERSLLPPGEYRVELAAVDPWLAAGTPVFPEQSSGNFADLAVGNEFERSDYLSALSRTEPTAILERFLATHDAQVLAPLFDSLDPEHVSSAVQAALGFLEIDESGALPNQAVLREAMAVLQPVLLHHPATLPTIAQMSGTSLPVDHRLRRLVVELGMLRQSRDQIALGTLSSTERQALWTLWAPIFLALDGDALADGQPEVVEASGNTLGMGTHLLFARAEMEERRTPIASYRFPGQELGIPVALLKHMRSTLGLIPTGPLDANSWTLANFEWLIRTKSDQHIQQRAEVWAKSCLLAAEEDVEELRLLVPEAAHHVLVRRPTAYLGELNVLPYLVGATALIERSMARQVLESSWLMKEALRGYDSPREAFSSAVELYTRDLCIFDLLLLSANYSGGTNERRT